MANGQTGQPVFNPDQPYNVVSSTTQAAPTAASPQAGQSAPAFNPNQPYDVVTSSKGQPETPEQSLGTFGKMFFGPETAAGAPPSETQQEEAGGVSDIMHGDVSQGLAKVVHAETPHVVQGSPIEKLIQRFKPDFRGSLTPEQAQDLHDKDYAGIERPAVDVAQAIDKDKHPVLKALTEAAQSMTSPANVAVMISTGGLGMVESPKALSVANKLISAGFSANAVGQAYKNLKSFKEAYDRGDANDALYQLTHAVTSGTMAYIAGAHAAGAPGLGAEPSTAAGKAIQERVVEPITEGVGRGAAAAGEAVKGAAAGAVSGVKRGLGIGDDFYTTVRKISPPSKGYAMEYNERLKTAEPQLREVFRQNPDVTTPQEMHDVIDQRIKQTEARLGAKAAGFEGKPEAQMTGIESQVRASLDKAFDENPGQYKPEEREKAVSAVMQHLLQEEPGELEGTKTSREPSLAEAEGVRQRFNQDTAPSFGAAAPSVPAAESFAKKVAANTLRQAIDEKFDQLGVKDVKEWRKQEAALIDVRDQIADAQKKADEMGTYNVFESLTKQLGWKTLLGFAAGATGGTETGLAGAMAASGLGAVADYIRDLKLNPIRKVTKAAELAQKPGPTGAALPKEIPPGERGPGAVNPTPATAAPAPGSQVNLPAGELPKSTSEAVQPAEAEYSLPTQPAMEIPADKRPAGTFSSDIHRHEWGHATVAAAEGFTPTQIISHLHPEIEGEEGTSAATGVTFHGIKIGPDGNWDPQTVRNNTGRVVSAVLGGAAADELFNEIPFEMNRHVSGDLKLIKSALKSIGMDDDEIDDQIRKGLDRAKSHLTQPGIGDILKANAAVREDNLPETHHVSESRMAGYVKELQRIRDENADTRAAEGLAENPARGLGEVGKGAESGRQGETEGETPEGINPRKMVEDQGLVYKGKIEGPTPETGVHQFESKDAPGVTMALREDKMTPETIRAKAEAKPAEGAIVPKANLRATKTLDENEFKQWFGKSKMIDASGAPITAYHGTTSPIDFDEFSTEGAPKDEEGNAIIGGSGDPNAYIGAHFAIGDNAAKIASKFAENKEGWMRTRYEGEGAKPRVIPVHLKIENPIEFKSEKGLNNFINEGHISDEDALNAAMRSDGIEDPEEGGEEVDDWIRKYDSSRDFRREQNEWILRQSSSDLGYSDESDLKEDIAQELGDQARSRLKEKGHDGVIYKNDVEGGKAAIAFEPDQILYAIPNAEAVRKAYSLEGKVAKQAAEQVKKGEGFAADMRTGKPTDTGFLVEVMPERRAILDHDVTPKDIQKFYNDNRDLFKANPELRVGGYKNELNISAHTENQQAAQELAGKLDQRSVWDVRKGEEIPTGGQGRVTHFSSYPFEDRMKDLRGDEEAKANLKATNEPIPEPIKAGNIDVNHRPIHWGPSGNPSTIYSATIPVDAKGNPWKGSYQSAPAYALVPTLANGKFLIPGDTGDPKKGQDPDKFYGPGGKEASLEDAATRHYEKTREHLGIFKSAEEADRYAEATHAWMPDGSDKKVYKPSYEGESNMPLTRKEYEQELSKRSKAKGGNGK